MKKFLFLISLLSSSAFAMHPMQCPPGNALHHPINGGEWQLDEAYKAQGFYVESDGANGIEIPAGNELAVKIFKAHDSDSWYPVCRYILNNEKGSIKLLSTREVQSPIPPTTAPFKSAGKNVGICNTTTENPAACSWNVF